MKLLFADDDRQIREGIKEGIDWRQLGIDEVLLAADGTEALSLFERSAPEIVITDIRMPKLDGLQLLSRIRQTRPDTRVVILSAYDDFEYMKKAIQYGAADYELKPIRIGSLIQLIGKIRDEQLRKKISEEAYRKYKAAYRDSLLQRWLEGKITDPLILREELAHVCDFDVQSDLMCVVAEPENDDGADEHRGHRRLGPLRQALEQRLAADFPRQWVIHQEERRLVLIFKLPSSMKNARETTERLAGLLKEIPKQHPDLPPVSAAFSSGGNAAAMHKLYAEALERREHLFYGRPAAVLPFAPHGPLDRGPVPDGLDPGKLREAIRRGDHEAVLAAAASEFQRLEAMRRYSRDSIVEYGRRLLRQLEDALQSLDMLPPREPAQLSLHKSASFADVREQVLLHFRNTLQRAAELQAYNHAAIRRVDAYIQEHFAEDLNVKQLAALAKITPNYFSHLYKKVMGISFTERLHALRIKKARELILHTDLLIYEIGRQVGYSSYPYFIQVFKKLAGCSPAELRKHPNIVGELNNL